MNRYSNWQKTEYASDPTVDLLPGTQKARAIGGIALDDPQGTRNTLFNADYTNPRFLGSRLHAQFYARDYLTRFFPSDQRRSAAFGRNIIQSYVDSTKTGGRAEVETALRGDGGPVIVWGADVSRERTAQPVYIYDPVIYDQSGGRVFRKIDERTWTPPTDQTNLGLFMQTEWRAAERWLLRAGARHERVWIDVDDYTTLAGNNIPGGKLRYNDTLFNAGLVFDATATTSLYANFSQGFSVADIGRVLRSAPRGFSVAQLRPEPQKVNNFELGLRTNWTRLQTSLALFYNRSNLGATFAPDFTIVRAPEKIYGAEAVVDVQPTDRLRFGGTGTWLEGKQDLNRNGRYTYLPGDRIPPLKLTAYFEHDLVPERWTNRLQLLYSGERKRFGNSADFGRGPVEDFATLDLLSSIRLARGVLRIGIENLLNRLYFLPISQWQGVDSRRAAARGATLNVGYTLHF